MDPGSIPGGGKLLLILPKIKIVQWIEQTRFSRLDLVFDPWWDNLQNTINELSWSSGLGRHPLTVEIAGSNPAGSGKYSQILTFLIAYGLKTFCETGDSSEN